MLKRPCALALLFLFAPTTVALNAQAARFTVDAARIERHLKSVLAELDVPSVSVGIVHGDHLVYAKSFGVANRETEEPATSDTLYQIASVTKTFTATLTAILRDEGVLRLDDPVSTYLPEDVKLPKPVPGGDPVLTLRHLMTHTSGFPLQPVNYSFEGRHNNNYTVKALYEGFAKTRSIAPIGARFSYSNLGYVLLGHCLARAAGSSYESLVKSRIFAPLGMDDSTITLSKADRRRLAIHYWSDDPYTATPPWIPGDIAAQGGITSSVRDVAKYLSMQFRTRQPSTRPMSGATLRETQRPQRERGAPDQALGFGWFIDQPDAAGRVLSHSGFTGGNSSYVAFSPAHRVGIVVLVNFGWEPAVRMGRWLITDAVRLARAQRKPTEGEARRLLARGDWPNAAWAYAKLVHATPNKGELHYRLGTAQWKRQKVTAAAAAFERAGKLSYSKPTALYNAARAHAAVGDRELALDRLRAAVAAGFNQAEPLELDPSLDPVREDKRFTALLDRVRSSRRVVPLPKDAIALYVGTYQVKRPRLRLTFFEKDGHLFARTARPGGRPDLLRYLGDHRFRAGNRTVTFRIEEGRAVGLEVRSGSRKMIGTRVEK